MKRNIELAVEDYGGKVLGKPIELMFLDSQSNPKTAVQQTVKGIAEGAQFITGAFSSSCTLAMMPIAAQQKIPHISFLSTHDDITGKQKTRYTFRTSTAQSAENKMTVKYLKDVGAKSVYAVGADYGVIRLNVDLILKDLESAGIKTYNSSSPMGTQDFSVIIEKVEKSDADTVLLMTLGRDLITLIKQLGQKGLTSSLRMASTLVVQDISDAWYPYSFGIVNTARYDPDFANDINKKWSNEVNEKYGPSNLLSPDY
jgi:branched-chain amino acid transport system substrate-binding protein